MDVAIRGMSECGACHAYAPLIKNSLRKSETYTHGMKPFPRDTE